MVDRERRHPAPTRASSRYSDEGSEDDSFGEWSDGSESPVARDKDAHRWEYSAEGDSLSEDADELDDDSFEEKWDDAPDTQIRKPTRGYRTTAPPSRSGGNDSAPRGINERPQAQLPSSKDYIYDNDDDEYEYNSDQDDEFDPMLEESEDTAWSADSNDDAQDSWDGHAPESHGGRRPARSSPPRPSAWTGDSKVRSSSGRRGGRGGGRGTVARFHRGAAARRAFGVQIPALDSVAIVSALRRQMGTAREAVGQAGSLAASTTKKLKREVGRSVGQFVDWFSKRRSMVVWICGRRQRWWWWWS